MTCQVRLRGVVRDVAIAVDLASDAVEILRRDERVRLPLRIDRAEEEQAVADGSGRPPWRPTSLSRDRDGVDGALDALHGVVVGFEAERPGIAERAALERIRAALGDDVDHAAGGLAELRFVAARLDLHFLHEVERRAVAERAEDDRVRPERAVAAVGDVHAVDDVLVLEAARSADRRIGDAHAAAGADARREIERVAEATADRQPRQCGAVETAPIVVLVVSTAGGVART